MPSLPGRRFEVDPAAERDLRQSVEVFLDTIRQQNSDIHTARAVADVVAQEKQQQTDVAYIRSLAKVAATMLGEEGCVPPSIPVSYFAPRFPKKGLHFALLDFFDRPRYFSTEVRYQPGAWPVALNKLTVKREAGDNHPDVHHEYQPLLVRVTTNPIALNMEGLLVTYPMHSGSDKSSNPFAKVTGYDHEARAYTVRRHIDQLLIQGDYGESFAARMRRDTQYCAQPATADEITSAASVEEYKQRFTHLVAVAVNIELTGRLNVGTTGVDGDIFTRWVGGDTTEYVG